MFIRKEKLANLESQIDSFKKDNERLKNKIEDLEEEKQNLKRDLENEHIENYEQHKKILKIENALKTNFGNYSNLLKFRNKVQSIIKNELADANLTNSNHYHT